ncbi:MAG: S-ribosylhomocysteine lyase [Clostridiales bacterium]|nr:S-ribosylhomocysteine lyase [Clostridiales bacterium]
MEIQRIKSFEIDHDILMPGFYISRVDGDIITYDMRTRRPNMGDYMSDLTMHSVEHMFATYIRNSEIASSVVYFGPMGCQTGFYLLVRNEEPDRVFEVSKSVLEKIIAHEGEVFGASAKECGNYRNLSLEAAKAECESYLKVLKEKSTAGYEYPKK